MTPSGMRGVLNDAVSIYFSTPLSRDDEPAAKAAASLHRTP
jgi:hypothetical protein